MRDRTGKRLPKVKTAKTLEAWREVEEPEEVIDIAGINPKFKMVYKESGELDDCEYHW